MSKTYSHIFDPEFAPLLRTAISHRKLSQRQKRLRVPYHAISTGALRTSLTAESRLLRDPEGNALVSVLNFDPELLDYIIQYDSAPEVIAGVVLDGDALARGFQSVSTYMETLIELSTTLEQENETVGHRLDVRLHQLTRWRVNQHLGGGENFINVARFVNERYGGGVLDEEQMVGRVELFLQGWGFTHSEKGADDTAGAGRKRTRSAGAGSSA